MESQFFVPNVVTGASHNRYHARRKHRTLGLSAREVADIEIINKAKKDIKRGSSCVSYVFLRSMSDGMDYDNKNLLPIAPNMPLGIFNPFRNAMLGLNNAVVGSEELELFVLALKSSGKLPDEKKLVFAYEGDDPSLGNTIVAGADQLRIRQGDRFLFQSADQFANPLFYLCDPDWAKYGVVANFNPISIFMGITNRNAYHILSGVPVKETNNWQFSYNALEKMRYAAEVCNDSRKGGGFGFSELTKLAWKEILGDPSTWGTTVRAGVTAGLNKLGIKARYRFSEKVGSTYLSYIMGDDALLKADVPMVDAGWDLDARHDYACELAKQEAAKEIFGVSDFADLTMLYPYADKMASLSEEFDEATKFTSYFKHFPEVERERCSMLGIEQYLSADGEFIGSVPEGTDIRAAVFARAEQSAVFKEQVIRLKESGVLPDAVIPNCMSLEELAEYR